MPSDNAEQIAENANCPLPADVAGVVERLRRYASPEDLRVGNNMIRAVLEEAAAMLTTLASGRDEWFPIETAPSNIDIDVWVTALEGEGWRMTGRLIADDPGCLETEDGDTYWPDQNGGYFTHWRHVPCPPQGDQP